MMKTVMFKNHKAVKIFLFLVLLAFFSFSAVFAQTTPETTRAPIDINLIIDGSTSFRNVRDEAIAWVSGRLDQILVEGDRVTVWNAGQVARVIYSGRIDSADEKEAVHRSIREISLSGETTDFLGALREANARTQQGIFSYTLLIKTSAGVLSAPEIELLRFSRILEMSDWRVIVVGLNLDARVRRAAAAFLNAQ
jgi:hypothetical protein